VRETVLVLYLVGGLLPTIGLVRVALRARRDVRAVTTRSAEPPGPRIAISDGRGGRTLFDASAMGRAGAHHERAPFLAWTQVRWDIALIGGGVVLTAAASAWSLYL
jgi:hypothetical protein